MRNGTAALGRVLSALLGLGLLAGGGSLLLWRLHVHAARQLYAHADRHWYATAAEQHWWSWTLAATMVFATLAGVGLLAITLRPNRLGTLDLAAVPTDSPTPGTTDVHAGALANAVATTLAKQPGVTAATGRAVYDRGLRTLRITISAAPDVPLPHLRVLAAEATADLAAATDESDLALQFFIHYLPIVD